MQGNPDRLQLEILRNKFAASVAHDIRSPLGSILGYVELMTEAAYPREEQKEFFDEIQGAIENAIELANQMVDFALLGEVESLTMSKFDLQNVLRDIMQAVARVAQAKSINLRLETSGTARLISSDLKMLHRSLSNLVDNAVTRSPANSVVRISVAYTDDSTVIRVRDAGPSLPQEELSTVFEKYFRAKHAPAGMPRCGLGLVLVRATIEALGGTVSAQNLDVLGVEFAITLPNEVSNRL